MKKIFTVIALLFASTQVSAQTSDAISNSGSTAGALANSGIMNADSGANAILELTFEGTEQLKSQRIHTTPSVYAPSSMFGGANNCGQSNTIGVGFTGFGLGGSVAGESDACNAREDTSIAYKLGYKEVADMRFFCFGEDVNRMAYEATGRRCPSTSTARGLPDNAVAGNVAPAAVAVPAVAPAPAPAVAPAPLAVAVNRPVANAAAVNPAPAKTAPTNIQRQTRAIASADEFDAQRMRTFYGSN